MRTLIWLLILPILLVLCALAAYRMPLPGALDGSRDLVAAVAAGLLGAGTLAALLLYLLVSLRRVGRALDATLARLSFHATWAPPFGRSYRGTLDRREVHIVYRPAYALQPAALDVTVDAQPGQRLAASSGPQRPLIDCRDYPRLALPELPRVHLYAEPGIFAGHEDARALLARPEVQSALDRLLDNSGTCELYLQPDRVWFRARLRMSPDAVAAWLEDRLPALSALAEAAEQIHP